MFLAEDQKLGRAVAVKLLNENAGHSSEAVHRLEREGRVLASINHPNVCGVSDLGRLDNGLPFIVMEHLTGETLAGRREREGRLPVPVAVNFAEQMLGGHVFGRTDDEAGERERRDLSQEPPRCPCGTRCRSRAA